MPRFDASVQMDSIQVQFRANTANAGGYVQVGLMSDPTDPATFVATGSFTPSTTNTWEYAAINTSGYNGTGRYIAFRVPQDFTNTFYIDDVTMRYIPNCFAVRNIQATNITATEAEISWIPGGNETTWNYFYGVSGSVNLSMTDQSQTTNTNSLHLTDLQPKTNYTIYIQSSCDEGETSGWMVYEFTTLCLPTQIPYYETFESYTGVTSYTDEVLPDCWSRINTGSYSSYLGLPIIYGNATYAQNGNNSLYFYSSQSLTTDYGNLYAILPEIDVNVNPIHTLQISFGLRKYLSSYDCNLIVGVIADVADRTTFVAVDTVTATSTTYSTVTVDFSSYSGTGRHIALFLDKNLSTTTSCGAYVDNIVVEPIPQCAAPTNLAVSNVTQTSATLNWTAGSSETSWEVAVVPQGDLVITAVPVTVNAPTLTLSTLTAGTKYDVYVRAICPNNTGYSIYTVLTLTTECYPLAQLPFNENFDSENGITTATTSMNNLPTCWHYINAGTNTYSGLPFVYNAASYANSGSNSLRFYTGTATTYYPQYAVLPQLDVQQYPVNTLQLELDMRKYSTSYDFFALVVGVMTDPSDDSTFVPVDTLYGNSVEYTNQFVYFTNYQGNGSYIALMAPKQMGISINGGYVDNISLDTRATCLRVQNDLAAHNITTDAVILSWTPIGTESNWIVEYRIQEDSVWVDFPTGSNPVTIPNLMSNTNYVFRVKADCGNGNVSAPTNPLTVTTDCSPMGIPYTENFDTYTDAPTSSTTHYLPSCWKHINTGSNSTYAGCPNLYSGSSYANSGTVSLRFFTGTASSYGYEYAIMPPIDTLSYPIQNLKLKMSARKSSTSYNVFRLEVGVMSDPYDANTFTPHDTVDFTSDQYVEKTVYFRNYLGYGNRIVLKAVKDAGVAVNQGYVDDIEISVAPNCLPVRDDVAVDNITDNNADISWTPNGTETEWLLRYKSNQSGDSFDTIIVSNTPSYTLSNLSPNTTYAVQVLASCGNGEYAATWTPIMLFTTDCSDMTTLPYNETFEGVVGTTSTSDHIMPDCWTYYNIGTSNTGMPQVYNGSTYAQGGVNTLKFYTGTPTSYSDQYAILPGINPTTYPMNTLQISFGARRYSTTSSYNFMIVVGVMSDPTNISTFVGIDTVNPTATTYTNFTVRFEDYIGTGKYIALLAPKTTGSTYNYGYVDNILVEVAPIICNVPTGLTAENISYEYVDLTWDANNADSWILQYKKSSEANWIQQPVATNHYRLDNLDPATEYKVAVKAVCDTNASSDWSAELTVTTEDYPIIGCQDPTDLTATELTKNSAKINWTENGAATSWTINYKPDGETQETTVQVSEHPYVLTGLQPQTTYSVYVVALCDDGVTATSGLINFTTLADGITDYELATSLYPNPNAGQFTIHNSQFTIHNVNVYDVYGKLLKTVEANANTVELDVRELSAGMYFVRVSTEKGVVTKSFVKK